MSPTDPPAGAVASPPVMSRDELVVALEAALRASPGADLDQVARALALSKRSLQRALVRHGSSFQAVRDRVRLAHAEHLLRDADAKVSGVARDIGFASAGHFIVWFRRHRGVTPGLWRARHEVGTAVPRDPSDVAQSDPNVAKSAQVSLP